MIDQPGALTGLTLVAGPIARSQRTRTIGHDLVLLLACSSVTGIIFSSSSGVRAIPVTLVAPLRSGKRSEDRPKRGSGEGKRVPPIRPRRSAKMPESHALPAPPHRKTINVPCAGARESCIESQSRIRGFARAGRACDRRGVHRHPLLQQLRILGRGRRLRDTGGLEMVTRRVPPPRHSRSAYWSS